MRKNSYWRSSHEKESHVVCAPTCRIAFRMRRRAIAKYELPANVTVTVHEGKTVVAKFHNKLKPVTDIPKTGDTTNMPLWAALAGISAIGAGTAAFFTFRKKEEVGKHER